MFTYMLPVVELLSVGREPLERSIWASLRNTDELMNVKFGVNAYEALLGTEETAAG